MVKKYINYFNSIVLNFIDKKQLYYVVENADWSIKHDGLMITSNLEGMSSKITVSHVGIRNSIIHYGSINKFFNQASINLPHKSNIIIVTWFHISPNDQRVKLIPQALDYVDYWHTSCESTKQKMIKLGIPAEKIIIIPLGVDLKSFTYTSKEGKEKQKKILDIPLDKIVIGSFQKDGNGWSEGNDPKLIKGPDIFCNVVEKLSKKYDIFVLLTGPARGYVKNRLSNANIPFKHEFFKDPHQVSLYYHALDTYFVTSREEGGPKSILESMASGIPLISSEVGMAPDIIIDNENALLVPIEDEELFYEKAIALIENGEFQKKLIDNSLTTVENFDWSNIAKQYYKKLYNEFL